MDRRKFLSALIGGVAAGAAVRTFPLRVYSFPTKITIADWQGGSISELPVALQSPLMRTDASLMERRINVFSCLPRGGLSLIEEISFAEAKARYGYEDDPENPIMCFPPNSALGDPISSAYERLPITGRLRLETACQRAVL